MKFTMTMDHVKLLNSMYVDWDDDGYGCPTIDSKRPYGNSDVPADVCKILGWTKEGDDGEGPCWSSKQIAAASDFHRQMRSALQIWLTTGACILGTYATENDYDRRSWKRIT